jgi:long-chain acyl-CoA synthetase
VDKPWLKSYPTGMPAEIDMKAFSSVRDILEKSCQRFADKPAYSNLGVTLTYRELDRVSRDSRRFCSRCPAVGQAVATEMPACPVSDRLSAYWR